MNFTGSLAFDENLPIGTTLAEFNATDPDGDSITYHLVDENGSTNNNLFTLDQNGTLKTAVLFDYETNASTYKIRVQAKDELNATTEKEFSLTLLDLNENQPPENLKFVGSTSFNEQLPIGSILGQFDATDPEGSSVKYSFASKLNEIRSLGNLKVWLDADSPENLATDENGTAPKDGESIQSWKDLSGNDHHARSVEGTPVWKASEFNTKPTLSFNNNTMAVDGSDQFNWSELTVFTTWKYPESKTWTTLFGRADSPTDVNSPWQFIARRADHSPPRYSFTLNDPSSTSSQFKK